MQTINTIYSNGHIRAKSWNGWIRVQYDPELNSEQNHRAAAEKLVAKLNTNKMVQWAIKASAPSVPGVRGADNGWTFIIGYVPEIAPMYMSITVRFMPSTNTRAAHMKVFSWLYPRGRTVNYTNLACGADIQGNARWAAETELQRINASCREHGDHLGYKLGDYVQTYNEDRLFTVIAG